MNEVWFDGTDLQIVKTDAEAEADVTVYECELPPCLVAAFNGDWNPEPDPDRVTSSPYDEDLRDVQRLLDRGVRHINRINSEEGIFRMVGGPAELSASPESGWLYRDKPRDAMEWAALLSRNPK